MLRDSKVSKKFNKKRDKKSNILKIIKQEFKWLVRKEDGRRETIIWSGHLKVHYNVKFIIWKFILRIKKERIL